MPYIIQDARDRIDAEGIESIKDTGELNYWFTTTMLHYFKIKGGRYAQINEINGAVEITKLFLMYGSLGRKRSGLAHNFLNTCEIVKSEFTLEQILGALEGAKLEFYRRIAAPYEDKKIEENGDVFS